MKMLRLPIAYMPLVDAAPLIVAQEMGFAANEGLDLDLIAAPSWSSVRDMLAFGRVDAAHLLSPVPVAMALGMGGVSTALSAVMVLSMNGDVIGVSRRLEDLLRADGHPFDFRDPMAAGAALARVAPDGLTIGAPFPFSMHVELLHRWFEATPLAGIPVTIRTVPPPLMAEALADGEIDAFCVGEPWGSVSVEAGYGALLLPGRAIWSFAPEKVLAVRTDWAETEPHLLGRLMRAVWRASRWLANPDARTAASEILSRPAWLDLPPEMIDRALAGRLVVSSRGEERHVDRFVEFHGGATGFPWRSQAKWIGQRLAQRTGGDVTQAMARAGQVFRPDIYRKQLVGIGADLPGANEKVEGALHQPMPVPSVEGDVILQPDAFLDGHIFDPYDP
ncbi:ABC transporter substrate-binding protein [Paracoccus sp. 1_MG-2023]|uniref:ABC transporter substrate-binding protein n=1 Tax=unclassified Paracoccus (in: a-proteobacteria) TaxID=2688777 RepID=UPI001C0840C3|nr:MULTISPECIES: ABC transporter substrate-binding protein [unclassified Paracoccus (in: a-proteobacteria)]MBU2957673.1 ABC transporter substrate-binding protein [Paracoccus sp. C2R09]MDO6667479.1 ABC transporter substrate-binding protein [Paracoccus sp. 1_MG-2023]